MIWKLTQFKYHLECYKIIWQMNCIVKNENWKVRPMRVSNDVFDVMLFLSISIELRQFKTIYEFDNNFTSKSVCKTHSAQ